MCVSFPVVDFVWLCLNYSIKFFSAHAADSFSLFVTYIKLKNDSHSNFEQDTYIKLRLNNCIGSKTGVTLTSIRVFASP